MSQLRSLRLVAFFLIVLAFTIAASARAAAPPETAAGGQLKWLLTALNGDDVPSDTELGEHFSPEFLAAVPPDQIVVGFEPLWSHRPVSIASLRNSTDSSLVARLKAGNRLYEITLNVASDGKHLIEGLLLSRVTKTIRSWKDVDSVLKQLGTRSSIYVGTARGRLIHSYRGDRVLAIGSAFKLYVLGALTEAVRSGFARWDESLAIKNAWKSLPSGDMRLLKQGTRRTLRQYANQMISASDNTAADHLMHRLGRSRVEAQLPKLGNSAISRNTPMLTTREFFALKLVASSKLQNAFAHGDSETRRRLLAKVDRLTPKLSQADKWTTPRLVDTIEWFASPHDMARTLSALLAVAKTPSGRPVRRVLAINPGVRFKPVWRYVGFKGGSEVGVGSLNWYLERADGAAFVISIVSNDDRREIDIEAAVALAQGVADLIARAQQK